MKLVIVFDLKIKIFFISTILMLMVSFGNYYIPDGVSQNSARGLNISSSNGAYPVMWCDYLTEGDNVTFQITSVTSNESVIFETGGLLVGIIGDIDDQVDNGYYGNIDSNFQYNEAKISKSLIPPILVPEKVYRACCGTFKPLTVQLEDWGWKNFSILEEGADFLRLSYHNDILVANITFNTDGLAMDFNASLTDFSYSAQLTSVFPHDSSTTIDKSTKWDFTLILFTFTIILLIKRRK